MIFQVFGSGNSTDVDIAVFVKNIPSNKESADWCYAYKCEIQTQYDFHRPLNINIATIENGIISAVYKGTTDELNNALFHTYDLHTQYFLPQITQLVDRNMEVKMLRCARKILSFLSRTSIRKQVKIALRGDFKTKLDLLSIIQLSDFNTFGKKGELIEFKKMAAFQLGQTLALMDEDKAELYTKEAIIERYPRLSLHLSRHEAADIEMLQQFLQSFVHQSIEYLPKMKQLRE